VTRPVVLRRRPQVALWRRQARRGRNVRRQRARCHRRRFAGGSRGVRGLWPRPSSTT